MSFMEAVYLGAIVGAVLFFAAGYLFHASRSVAASGVVPAAPPEHGVDELLEALHVERAARQHGEEVIQQLHAMIAQLRAHGG